MYHLTLFCLQCAVPLVGLQRSMLLQGSSLQPGYLVEANLPLMTPGAFPKQNFSFILQFLMDMPDASHATPLPCLETELSGCNVEPGSTRPWIVTFKSSRRSCHCHRGGPTGCALQTPHLARTLQLGTPTRYSTFGLRAHAISTDTDLLHRKPRPALPRL